MVILHDHNEFGSFAVGWFDVTFLFVNKSDLTRWLYDSSWPVRDINLEQQKKYIRKIKSIALCSLNTHDYNIKP